MSERVGAVLWKRLTASDFGALRGIQPQAGTGGGQKDIRLRGQDVGRFFGSVPITRRDRVSQWRDVEIEAIPGTVATPSYVLPVSHADGGARPSEWRLARQAPDSGYPPWVEAAASHADPVTDPPYILLIRTNEGTFHARVVAAAEVTGFPDAIREGMLARDQGVRWFDGPPDGIVREIVAALASDHNVLLYGPPGTGKTWAMIQVRNHFLRPNVSELHFDPADPAHPFTEATRADESFGPGRVRRIVSWVTFHQGYGYEEFIIGVRPVSTTAGGFSLQPRPGPFLDAAESARASDTASLLLIDEVNRANASRTFGELITLLEPDKRLREDGTLNANTVSVRLPYLDAPYQWKVDGRDLEVSPTFAMPSAVYMLASMNSVDRSVAPLDTALRRRFRVIELLPDYDLLESASGSSWDDLATRRCASAADWAALGIRLLHAINDGIRVLAGDDFLLGHAYIWSLTDRSLAPDDARTRLVAVWDTQLLPQLIELFRVQPEQLAVLLGATLEGRPDGFPYRLVDLPSDYAALGANRPIETPPLTGTGTEAIEDNLRWIARAPIGLVEADESQIDEAPVPTDAGPPPLEA